MPDSYVCSGAMMRCTMGTSPAQLTVLPSRTVFLCGQPMANISDHKSMVNLAPFGLCRSLGFPATASATAAHHGVLTPMPCVHKTPAPWMPGKTDYFDKSQPSLLKSCKLQCMWGGMISIIDDGQKGEGTQYVNKSGKNSTEEIQAESNEKKGLTPKAILDGIQLTLDIAGLAPGVGAIADLTNAAIYAFRGDMVNAGLSLFAAVPGAGDAATATKLVGKGLKAAKAAGKTTEVVSKTVKTADKAASTVSYTEKSIIKTYSRPSGFRKGVKEKVWENAKKKGNGTVYSPDGKIIKETDKWDMGHKPGYEFRKHQESARNRGISREQFLDEYNNPEHYRPETPSFNRSHKGEDVTDNYFGP